MSTPVWQSDDLAANPHARGDKAAKVQAMFAAIARAYDLNNRLHSFGLDQRWRKTAVRLAEIKAGDRVVDVACGTGDLTELFAQTPAASVLGLDFTPQMLDIARSKSSAARSGRGSNTRQPLGVVPSYEHGDATALALENASVDVLSIAFGLRNVSDPLQALREFRRVLRPGGRLVVLEFDEPTNPLIRGLNRLYTHRIMPWTATWIARDSSGAYRYLPRSVETFLDRARLAEALRSVGFAEITQKPLTFGTCVITVAR
jgi:demethylmenaquinone methyltransferase / 2-methoxy-6-polyprenyl-1,4-benzoquinol methylase